MDSATFLQLANLGEQLEQTRKRKEMTALLAEFLQDLEPQEIPAAVRLTIGQIFPEWDGRALNISWKTMMAVVDNLTDARADVRAQASAEAVDGGQFVYMLLEQARRQPPTSPLMIMDVFHTFEEIAGATGRGSCVRKESLLRELLERATPVEAKYLAKIIYGEMRHGVSEGLMLDAIAIAAGIKSHWVRRANQLWGDLGEVAWAALTKGDAGLRSATVRLFRPLKPMLAQTANDLPEAFERFGGRLALEYKLDGARVQLHGRDEEVRIYSRNLTDVTDSLPDVADHIRKLQVATEFIVEGEAIAVDPRGRPLPFQHLMRRFRRKHAIATMAEEIPVDLHLFDLLYLNGESLVDVPYQERWSVLNSMVGSVNLIRRIVPETLEEGKEFAESARRDGHEGLMAKDLTSAYTPGVRGRSWLKVKHVMSLDLVIAAADWGYGRRHGWLSNYHLAVFDEETREFLVVGKTFKGLSDAEFQAMTERLLVLELGRQRSTVFVQPRIVVEVLFNEIQQSGQYRSGMALRFARISRIREDKNVAQADTLQTLRALYEKQFEYKGRP